MDYWKRLAAKVLPYIYSCIFIIYIPIVYLTKVKKSLKNKHYRDRWAERLGITPLRLKDCIWFHSVSVGETLAAEPLVRKLMEDFPEERIVITTTTPTGSDAVLRLYKGYDNIYHTYIPYDVKPFINSFFVKLNPQMLVIVETEIWPNILCKCFAEDIPVIITNARLSKRSMTRYSKIPLSKEYFFNLLAHVSAQDPIDAERYKELGVLEENVSVTGNIKYNMIVPADLQEKTQELVGNIKGRPVWVAGSTHDGEENVILEAHKKILKIKPDCLLILVPRHKERFNKVSALITEHGLEHQRRKESGNSLSDSTQVYLADTMGELMQMYYVADITFVAGSVISKGGHNMLEPASLAKPVISGKNLKNFVEIAKSLTKNDALEIATTSSEIADKVIEIFDNPAMLKKLSENSLKTFKSNEHVLDLQYKEIAKLL
jgi:3-deoxy-D-manno-octulosonic-acid transferase